MLHLLKNPYSVNNFVKTGIMSLATATLATGCVLKPDLTVSDLKKWQLPNSEFKKVDDLDVHVVQSNLCHTIDRGIASTINSDSDSLISNQGNADGSVDKKANETDPLTTKIPEVMVLLHGTSASLHTWEGWAAALDDKYCVVRMDLPGFGLTGPYKMPDKTYSLDNYVDTVINVMDELQVSQATIAGNSLGGGIAWLTTLKHPKRVNRLVIIDSIGFEFKPKHVPIAFQFTRYPMLTMFTENVLPKSLVRKSLESVYADDSKVTDELVNRYYDLTRRAGNRHALSQRFRQRIVMHEVTQLPSIKQPTLILWGEKDDLIPIDNAYRFKQALPNSELVVFENLGHVPHEEDPKATVEAVIHFLNKHPLDE